MIQDFAKRYLLAHRELLEKISLDSLDEAAGILYLACEDGRRIFVFGNGGSASTASHFACDINKGACAGIERKFKVICLNDSVPTMLAYANDISYENIFVEQLKNFLERGDVVLAISGSGNSANVVKAVEYANKKGTQTLAFTGFDGGTLAKTARTSVIVPSDDMQKIEDMHLVFVHILMQYFSAMVSRKPAVAEKTVSKKSSCPITIETTE